MTDAFAAPARPRDRILGTARSLFRQCGIRGAGVDTIAESAGTNKMTLYRHFHSKDDLIIACLREASVDADKSWSEIAAAHPSDPKAQLEAWVRVIDRYIHEGVCCEVANAAVELPEASEPVRATIIEFKNAQRDRLVRLCAEAGARDARALADMLCLLMEGARVSRQAVGENGPNRSFIDCAMSAIASFGAAPPGTRAG